MRVNFNIIQKTTKTLTIILWTAKLLDGNLVFKGRLISNPGITANDVLVLKQLASNDLGQAIRDAISLNNNFNRQVDLLFLYGRH